MRAARATPLCCGLNMLVLIGTLLLGNMASPLGDDQVERARTWVDAMKTNRRGPYQGVSWFCNDGTIQEPRPYMCSDRGGGFMYGVLSANAETLASWGIHVGTVLTSLPPGSLSTDSYYRARALVVEAYLERALDGWVLEQAKDYRGFRQMEDEVEAARWHLIDMAMRADVLERHRNLLVRTMRALPYGQGGSRADQVRALAGVLGDDDTQGFGALRFKIHAMPEPADITRVLAYADDPTTREDRADKARELAQAMHEYYQPTHRLERLREVRKWLHDSATRAGIDEFAAVDATNPLALLRAGADLIETAERALAPGNTVRQGERNLLLLHVMAIVEELWIGVTADFSNRPMSRALVLEMIELLVRSGSALGWFSPREKAAVVEVLAHMRAARPDPCRRELLLAYDEPVGPARRCERIGMTLTPSGHWAEPGAYAAGLQRLGRLLEWSRARLLADLGIALGRYAAVEPRARGVIDDQLRSSSILPLAALLDRLGSDVERLRGGGHELYGLDGVGTASLRGQNPGLASGPLRVLAASEVPAALRRHEVALLHDLPPELPPVAGIITVGAAGSLSHVSLLARNLGIPHAAIGGDVAEALAHLAGQEVVLGVSSGGRVVLGSTSQLPRHARDLITRRPTSKQPLLEIDADALNLDDARIRTLSQISEADSGVVVGPKAAELGRLKRLFPDRVSDAVVIPFGVFLRHVERGETSPIEQLRRAYLRSRSLPPEEAERLLLAELEVFRAAIGSLPFPSGFETEVDAALAHLGAPGTFGVFVRSDTNVEDLEKFTGAGLNLTVANRVDRGEILAAIRRVWASPFTERSYRWRQRILANPEHVYPSVILHRTVPSEISGVMVTTDLETGANRGITISASEGVAAVVDGGAPETIVVDDRGEVRLLASSRSATRKAIPAPPGQGVVRMPAEGRDPLLGPAEIADLQQLAAQVKNQIPAESGLPWDIEFGFYRGKAFLMQIRPLRTHETAAHPFLCAMDDRTRMPTGLLDLAELVP
jgi:hypothetical protein